MLGLLSRINILFALSIFKVLGTFSIVFIIIASGCLTGTR